VWSATVVPLPLLAMSLLIDGPHQVAYAVAHLPTSALLSTAYTAYLASLVGYGIWNTLLARHPAALVAPFALLVPPVGIATAWIVQGERPGIAEALGGALLLAGVAVTTRSGRRARYAVPTTADELDTSRATQDVDAAHATAMRSATPVSTT
jgi:O-acetylserine/cysteine efflux transporter